MGTQGFLLNIQETKPLQTDNFGTLHLYIRLWEFKVLHIIFSAILIIISIIPIFWAVVVRCLVVGMWETTQKFLGKDEREHMINTSSPSNF